MQLAGKFTATKGGRFFVGDFGPRHYIHVYAVAPVGGGNVKFGKALDVKSRFSGIQTGSPVKLELLGSVYVPVEFEFAIHCHLAEDRSHGEWFLPTAETIEIVRLIVEQKTIDLAVRLHLYKMVPQHVLDEINHRERMTDSARYEQIRWSPKL